MSYDLTIKSDDEWSQYAQVKPLIDFVATLPHMRPNGDHGFAMSDGPRYMEIVGTVKRVGSWRSCVNHPEPLTPVVKDEPVNARA